MEETDFITLTMDRLFPGVPLPGPVFLFIDGRFLLYRSEGDQIDTTAYDRLLKKKIGMLFIRESEVAAFERWEEALKGAKTKPLSHSQEKIRELRGHVSREMFDLFRSDHPEQKVRETIKASKSIVSEIMKLPALKAPLRELHTWSQGTMGHSVNVSVLSSYLAMNMGYSHTMILQHLAAGALLHDIGKAKVQIEDNDVPEVVELKLRDHPGMGTGVLALSEQAVSREVVMIIAQHHENFDGSGYPNKLRGNQIYDLARIVSIANTFDRLVGEGKGTLDDRQKGALFQIQVHLKNQFDPEKLVKAVKILSQGV